MGVLYRSTRVIGIVIAVVICVHIKFSMDMIDKPRTTKHPLDPGTGDVTTFTQALARVASQDRTILLSLIDKAYVPMAINFYLTSLRPHKITNYLILTMDPDACRNLDLYGINCYFYKHVITSSGGGGGGGASKWGTREFQDKMNVRSDMILDAMDLGYTVLHSDVDVYFYKNPFQHISCDVHKCDMAVLMDKTYYNAGFLFINPSAGSKNVYKFMKYLTTAIPFIDDQNQLNRAIKREQNRKNRKSKEYRFNITSLPMKQFQCGVRFYEDEHRYFAPGFTKPCPECVVVHNNWIITIEAKIYRAKELHQWVYDGDGYYTSEKRRYLTYDNPLDDVTQTEELRALGNALGMASLLNRTLVLPAFHCQKIICPLNSLLRIQDFDKSFTYREHSFLDHPLVPESVKNNRSPAYVISSKKYPHQMSAVSNRSIRTIDPVNAKITSSEIVDHFGGVKESILQFHSMYHGYDLYADPDERLIWMAKMRHGFKRAFYQQGSVSNGLNIF